VLVSIDSFEGSSPREVGAWMLVTDGHVQGTLGGGHLEFDAIAHARGLLRAMPAAVAVLPNTLKRYALGPALGQCCGGVVQVRFECLPAGDTAAGRDKLAQVDRALRQRAVSARTPVALFGGGHVGRAIVQALAPLPFAVHWIDSRDEIFPPDAPGNVQCEHSQPVHGAVRDLAAGALVLIMSFSHAEDLDVVAACLQRQRQAGDLPFVGLIGSKTKWATFAHRLTARGFTAAELTHITSPIGVAGITGKEPAVIAASVVAQLLQNTAVKNIPTI
jgi:xanthine dehydrogenase accessory factor